MDTHHSTEVIAARDATPKRVALRALGFVLTATALVYLYGSLSRHWTPIGGTKAQFCRLEVPLFVFAAWIGYVRLPGPHTKLHRFCGWLSACLPPLLLFALIDGGYEYLRRCLRFSDFLELRSLLEASPGLAISIAALLAGITLIPLVRLALLLSRTSALAVLLWSISRLVGVALLFVAFTAEFSPARGYALQTVGQHADWSEQWTMRKNGRFASVVYFYVRRTIALERMSGLDFSALTGPGFDRPIEVPRNVYIIVLESLIDPRLLDGVEFDRSPLHPRMRMLLGDDAGTFDLVTSPVYGGGTAQTEFELLTGLPALARVGSIEFNALEGHAVPSLVRALRSQGYKTLATVATSPKFYNARRAYRSLGFEEVHFLDGDGYLGSRADGEMFDGELLELNLDYVTAKFLEPGHAFLNYVVGMYGHHPYQRDTALRPDVCRVVPDGDGSTALERIANQFYYRTGEIAAYLEALQKRDPSAIVFVTSDHLPPLLGGGVKYRHGAKQNICVAFAARDRIEWNGEPVFHVPYALFGAICGEPLPIPSPAQLEQCYFATIAAGLGLTPR
jgi:hypothetical protein